MPHKDPDVRRAYRREYQKRWYQENRELHIERVQVATRKRRALFRERINALKQRACADCGVLYPPFVMDFDHVDGKKLDDICTMRRRLLDWQTIVAEIEKCDVVCSNCHRSRTYFRKLGVTPPGTALSAVLGANYIAIPVPSA